MWAGFVLPFYRGVGLFNWSGFLVTFLFWLWLSILCPVCGLLYDWFAGWQLLILFRADAPFPMFIGEVLSVCRFLWEPVSCMIVCGALPFWK